jgi:hypothetical protein
MEEKEHLLVQFIFGYVRLRLLELAQVGPIILGYFAQ